MKINIFGLGYVGSVSAACLAAAGHDVLGIDIDRTKVDQINQGMSPVAECGLPELIDRVFKSKHLRATADMIEEAAISMICVGTPSNENGSLCLDYMCRAAEQIGDALRVHEAYHVVCIRSTVLPGSIEACVLPILERQSGKKAGSDFGVCMNPEFLREGSSLRDYHCPPFTIIGELDTRSGDVIEELYAGIPGPIIRTTLGVAEMVKYAGNAFHALKVTFANEIGNLCKRLGVDGPEVMSIFCRDQKLNVSTAYLQPGFAFGGSCLPKDLRALLYKAKELDLEPSVLRSILVSNIKQVEEAYKLIKKTGKKSIAMLGLSFKPGTDDLRESPSAALVERLIGTGHEVAIYDKDVSLARIHGSNKSYIEQTIPHISRLMRASAEEAIGVSDVVVIAKRAPEFEEALEKVDDTKFIIDLVRALPHGRAQNGQRYEGLCW